MQLITCLRAFLAGVFLVSLNSTVAPALADYYKYTDDKGIVCITNKVENVPAKYRQRMKVVRDETLSNKDTVQPKAPAATPSPPMQENAAQSTTADKPETAIRGLTVRYPWLKPLAVVVALLAGFMLVAKIASILPSPMLGRLIYIVFFMGIFLFAYKSYADYMVTNYFSVKEKILVMFKKANVRQASELEEPGLKK